ncbi:MAG TPA: M24 family metallopeptidase, partial [Oscillospiraceae bacterium]|nr:M24 family metallopeptidase [Oscillospiraceae bacterium]
LLFDFGAVYDGYHSDMTRTVCFGNPSGEMQKVYDIVLKAQLEALNAAKAGMKCSELDKIARDIISNAGYGENFGHSLGHGVGLEIHEFPTASPKSETVLEENMVVTVEPGIYLPGKFGVRIEDFAVITGDGCINLTNTSKNFVCL